MACLLCVAVATREDAVERLGSVGCGGLHLTGVSFRGLHAGVHQRSAVLLQVGVHETAEPLEHLAEADDECVDAQLQDVKHHTEGFRDTEQHLGRDIKHVGRKCEHLAKVAKLLHELVEDGGEIGRTLEQYVSDCIGDAGAAGALCPAPLLDESQELVGYSRHGRREVANDLAHDAVDGCGHQVKSVVHVGDVVDLRLADDDAEPLGTGLQFFNAGRPFTEQRSQSGPLLAEDGDSGGSTVCGRRQLRDRLPDL